MGILANNDGKILRANTTGNVIKQNYNFGRAFYRGSSTNCYIELPAILDIQKDFSILTWFETSQTDSPFSHQFIIRDDLDQCFLTSYRVNDNKTLLSGDSWNTSFSSGTPVSNTISGTTQNGKTLTAAIKKNNDLIQKSDLKSNNSLNQNWYNTQCRNIYLNAGNATAGIRYNISPISFLAVYNRAISDSEYLYLYNNKLGNNLLNLNLLKAFFKMDSAEIFDFGGTIGQAVGVRDYSGNTNHGRIINLPSGTLQEQLDYANANLFELW